MPSERRTSFTCYPVSAAAAYTILRGWLKILSPAQNTPVQFTSFGQKQVTAQILVHRGYALQVGDILEDTFDDRVYLVQQTGIQSPNQLVWVQEIRRPLPDRFDTISLKSFWTNELTLPDNPQYYGYFYCDLPTGANFLDAGLLWQQVTGDFDIWADVNIESFDEASYGPVAFGLICARDPETGYGVGVGQRWTVTPTADNTYRLVRVDYNANGQSIGTEAPPYSGGGGSLFRLQRTEGILRAYRGKGIPNNTPPDEYDFPADFWVPMGLGSYTSHFISTETLQVGIGGWKTGGSYGYVASAAIRNWLS